MDETGTSINISPCKLHCPDLKLISILLHLAGNLITFPSHALLFSRHRLPNSDLKWSLYQLIQFEVVLPLLTYFMVLFSLVVHFMGYWFFLLHCIRQQLPFPCTVLHWTSLFSDTVWRNLYPTNCTTRLTTSSLWIRTFVQCLLKWSNTIYTFFWKCESPGTESVTQGRS